MKKIILILMTMGMLSAFGFGQKMNRGTIEGKLMYPSEYIPPTMIVCVEENKENGKTICSDSKNYGYTFKVDHDKAKYSVKLPVGEYFVFATFPSTKAPVENMEEQKAYYNEFVTCGLRVECTSHEKISVKVEKNKTISDITPGDWYQ